MLSNLSTIDDIKKWVFVELTGGESNDDPDIYFELPLNDKELSQIVDITLRDFMQWAYNGIEEGYYVLNLVSGQSEYDVPKNIFAIPYQIRADDGRMPNVTLQYTDFVANPVFYMGGNQIYGNSLMDTVSSYYVQQNVMIQNMRFFFQPMGQFRFYYNMHKLVLMKPPNFGDVNPYYKIFKCYHSDLLTAGATGMDFGSIFDEPLMRNLLLARCKKKVGWSGKVIPQNLLANYTVDFNAIYTEGKADEETFIKELHGRGNITIFDMG